LLDYLDVGSTQDAAFTKEKKVTLKGYFVNDVITVGVDVKANKSYAGTILKESLCRNKLKDNK